MSVPPPAGKVYRFNPPPNWPTPPPGWTPPQGWAPPASWPPPPHGWQFWVEALPTVDTQQDTGAAGLAGPALAQPEVAVSRSRGMLRWAIIGGTIVVGLVIAKVAGGILGHVFALIIWAAAAWLCIRPARARTASASRMWARIGVAVFACLAVYAGSLAIVGKGTSQQSSLSSQADAVMQLNDTPFNVTQSPGSQDIQVINSAAKAFNAAVTVTNDPTQQDTDYTNIGYDLGQVQQDIQGSDWVQYYNDLGNVRSDIQSARADGTLSGP